MHKITVDGKTKYVPKGTLLSDILTESGKGVEHLCGGRGTCKKCSVLVNGKEELSCQYRINSDIAVVTSYCNDIVSETGADETQLISDNLCFCIDIGTTTLALALVSLDENKIIKVITHTNPQRAFGADVMTRIDYCRKNGVSALHKSIVSKVNEMIAQFNTKNIEKLYVTGNTTMLHLFFGIDCSSMGVAPYTPTFLHGKTENGETLGVTGVKTVESLPSISAFMGADLVAGLNFADLPKQGKYSLLIDLGTNAEIILFSESSYLCTSAAAGPCFEGANISNGMSATDGAIYSYSKDEVKTIGNIPAKGICGTGLIDIIAELLKSEAIDKTGFMECESFEISNEVCINQDDIRQYQLAKSAVYSAILTLLQTKDISFDDIEKLYISGGFSAKINIENAVRTGLLPKELSTKCIALNNSSLLGTVKFACEQNDLSEIIRNAVYVDLSANTTFSDLYIENMLF